MGIDSFDKSFKRTGNFMRFFFIMFFVIIIGGLAFRGCVYYNNKTNGRPTYVISVPSYDGYSDTYMTSEYIIKDNCIRFKDETGIKRTICGPYTIDEY